MKKLREVIQEEDSVESISAQIAEASEKLIVLRAKKAALIQKRKNEAFLNYAEKASGGAKNLDAFIEQARDGGMTWAQIGKNYGMSGKAVANAVYRKRIKDGENPPSARDLKIIEMVDKGVSRSVVAATFGVATSTVMGVIANNRARKIGKSSRLSVSERNLNILMDVGKGLSQKKLENKYKISTIKLKRIAQNLGLAAKIRENSGGNRRKRNEAIVKDIDAGKSLKATAKKHHLGELSIRLIVKRAKEPLHYSPK